MTSVQQSRYALFHHDSQVMTGTIGWRITPRSKQFVAIVPPTVVPGTVRVIHATDTHIKLQLSQNQVDAIQRWTEGLPEDVMRPTACDTGQLEYKGVYSVIGGDMKVTGQPPPAEAAVRVRVTASVRKVGPLYKAVINVVDVMHHDVAAQ
jgi:hypothetical protein